MLAHLKGALIVLVLVISCSPVFAQDDPRGLSTEYHGPQDGIGHRSVRRDGHRTGIESGMRGREFRLGHLLNDPALREQLGVSAEQAAKIRQQESDFRKTEIRGRADLEVQQIDLRDLLTADKPDRAAIDAKLQEISASRLAFQKSAIDFRLNSRDQLTPKQREKLHQIIRDRHRRADDPGSHGPRGMGPSGEHGPGSEAMPQRQASPNQ